MRGSLSRIVHALLVLAVAGVIGFLSTRLGIRTDWSDAQRASLAQQSQELLLRLDAPVEVISYASEGGTLRQGIAAFIARYQQHKSDIALAFVDPAADPAAMRKLGVSVDGEVELRYRGRSERLQRLNEREFSTALLRLSRNQERIVAFLSGNGERKPDGVANADLAQFTTLLLAQGVRCVPLVVGSGARIPDNTDLLVIADPRASIAPPVAAEIVDWVERGGALLWLAEPGQNAGLDALADALSVRVLPGLLVDGSGASLGLGDPSFVVLGQYPDHVITHGFALTTLFPQSAPLAQLTTPRWRVQPLLRSSAQSWSETGPIPKAGETEATIRFDADTDEMRGPLDLAFALERLSPRPDRREQRAAIVGDADFLSNQFLGNGGNRELGQRLFNWLLADDALIEIADRGPRDRLIALSQTRLSVTAIGFLVVIPLVLVLTGSLLVWRRRRR